MMTACIHDRPALKCIAHVYSPSQAALKLSALEAAGFGVFMPWFHTLGMLQHHAIALGGMPLFVPHEAAEDAADLLAHIEEADEAARRETQVHRTGPNSLLGKAVLAWIYISTGTGPAMNVTFPVKSR